MAENTDDSKNTHTSGRWFWIAILSAAFLIIGFSTFVVFKWGQGNPQLDDRPIEEQWSTFEFQLDDDERDRLLSEHVSYEIPDYWQERLNGPIPLPYSHAIVHGRVYAALPFTPNSIPEGDERKVVVTDDEFRQFFIAYTNQTDPVFVTTDSILNAFHVVLEDSFIGIEAELAAKLTNLLAELRTNLKELKPKGAQPIVDAAKRRAEIMLAVAHCLSDSKISIDDPQLAATVNAEVARVETAAERTMPAWLGKPRKSFLAIDYSHFRPVGTYSKSPTMQRYFRAIRWLQKIPFHVDRDEELLAIQLIAIAANKTEWSLFAATYHEFLGDRDDWDLQEMASVLPNSLHTDNLGKIRESLLNRLENEPRPGIVPDLLRAPTKPEQPVELNFRVLSALRLPESVLFARTHPDETRWPPSGLEMCVALKSDFARDTITHTDPELLKLIDQTRDVFVNGKSIYADYLRCLATLFAEPHENAPEFMSSNVWHAKSCQSALSSWVQARHTFTLHAKKSDTPANGNDPIARGFVEPNPEFYRRLGKLVSRIQAALRRVGIMELSFGQLELQLREFIRLIQFRSLVYHKSFWVPPRRLTQADKKFLRSQLSRLFALDSRWWVTEGTMLAAWVQLLDSVEERRIPDDPNAALALKFYGLRIEARWDKLKEICTRLEQLATKQLNDEPFDKADDEFLVHYGDDLGALLLYESHAGLDPEDDVMRVVEIAHSGESQRHFHAAIGRPRAIYVRYPYQGKEILCRGAVLPYYEFTHSPPMTDDEWKTIHDSDKRPQKPKWLDSLYTN